MEKVILRLKIHYNAVTRTFKLVGSEFNTLLEGDGLYELTLPVLMYDEAEMEELISTSNVAVAHA
jgi:hypothetical protein